MTRRALITGLVVLALAWPWSINRDAESGGLLLLRHHLERGFRNLDPSYAYPIGGRLARLVVDRFQPKRNRGPALAVLANNAGELRANGHESTVTWVGHSTL